ncbi:MAG: pantoate--beta-alanine ligase [Candidatus Omnitrophota bacterium]
MKIIHSLHSIRRLLFSVRRNEKSIGFVPTMGALHHGHISLINRARIENDLVVTSIFVNPIQFGPQEDYTQYPRNFRNDSRLCRKNGVDFLFYPSAQDIYRKGHKTFIKVAGLGDSLCGEFRPGHFQGVATIVTKLLNIIQPDKVYFGQKDAQQAVIIKKMVEDLNIPVKIKVMPTVREKDGLAVSSRNVYLNSKQRKSAAVLYQALVCAANLIKAKERNLSYIRRAMIDVIGRNARVQYIAFVDNRNLQPVKKAKGRVLIALSAFLGRVRLIDNIVVNA